MSQKKPQQLQIKLQQDGESAEPKFSNMATIEHSDDTFLVDFLFVHARTRYGKLLSRVALTPAHAKRLLNALQENVSRYEEKHGPIVQTPAPVSPSDMDVN
ncbi:MAG: DUF3467 domain-containing protein [Chrysiogenetes bacterium]|nr:DUF3467 domain-containing protein [Chrysiogenetes bacterium]